MNITFIVSGLGTGGAEFALRRLCNALRKLGVRPRVVSLRGDGDVGPLLRDDGVPVDALPLQSPLAWARAHRELAGMNDQRRLDVVQGWMYHGNLAALYLAPRNTPVAWGVRQSLLGNRDKFSTKCLIHASAVMSKRVAAIVYNSDAARVQHEAIGFAAKRAAVIPNGLDLDEIWFDSTNRTRERRALGFAADEFVIGHVARFHPSKDHAAFLRALAHIAKTRPSVRAVLVGEGVDSRNTALASLIARLGIADRVVLLGRRSNVFALMSSFDLFCSSSAGMEGFPNVVAEAMSCEVPCVATDVGDARAVVDGGGLVVPAADVTALANALGRIVDLPATARRELGQAARRHVVANYAIDAIASRYLRMYEALAASRGISACAD